ncbi:protease [Fervidicella metallireducens AeB]|uniref:Protease n=1 Tax=Fervidicella metallireducens AeB TaxID=1403537 RepID=A0A017RZD4_9CLOT|nr:S41 family peptidase [Fervidicella metallireducens]EYE89764.1 protease [Fervidicella metallireducens AeB]
MKTNKWGRYIKNSLSLLFVLMLIINFAVTNVYAVTNPLEEAKAFIKNNYVGEVSDEVLNSSTVEDMVSKLGDKYSQYFTAKEFEDFLNSINNKFIGIGIHIDMVPEGVKILSIISNSPAEEAGLKPGDIILEASGHQLSGMKSEEAVTYIKGEEGTKVTLIIKRGETTFNLEVERRQISVPTVETKILDNNIGYIEITSFGEDTAELFGNAVKEMKEKKVNGFIIDLRYNPGGFLDTALNISGYFIGSNNALIVENKSKKRQFYSGYPHSQQITEPVIFLVNEYSASASEVLSAAVKDYDKAFLVGTKTFGKGTVQAPFMLSDGSVIKLTIQQFLSPKGNIINKVGISPDLEVKNKEMDSLLVAQLLLGKSTDVINKSGYLKVKIGSREFEIDLNKAKDEKYWDVYRNILENVNKDEVYLGTDKGWQKAEIKEGLISIKNSNSVNVTGSKVNTATKNTAVKKIFKVITCNLNVRSQATTKSKVIGVLKKGTKIEVTTYKNGWYRINYKGNPAYIYGKYVK